MAQPYVFCGNAYRKMAELNDWTKQRHEAPLEPDLPIIDPHHHVWDDDRGRYLIHELAQFPNLTVKLGGLGVLWNAMKRITQSCPAADKAAMYHGTAARVYRLAV